MNLSPANMNKKGFTLIELLVVIAIIGLLSSVVMASLNQSRERAKLARAAQDLKQITNALYLYLSDNGHFPEEDGNWDDSSEREKLAPYIVWPKNPFGGNYHWEINYCGIDINDPGDDGSNFDWIPERYFISIKSDNSNVQGSLDEYMDDGNKDTGKIRYINDSGSEKNRIEYIGIDGDRSTVPPDMLTYCYS